VKASLYLQKAKPVASCDEALLLPPKRHKEKAYASAPENAPFRCPGPMEKELI